MFPGTPRLPWGCHWKLSSRDSWLGPQEGGVVDGHQKLLLQGNQSAQFKFQFFCFLTGGALTSYMVPFSLGRCENKEMDCVTAFNSWSLTWKEPKNYSARTSPLRPYPLCVAQTRRYSLRDRTGTWKHSIQLWLQNSMLIEGMSPFIQRGIRVEEEAE